MKFKIYKSLAMCTLLLGLAACNDFEEMNTDPMRRYTIRK